MILVEIDRFFQRLVACAEGPFTSVCIIMRPAGGGKPTKCSDISIENSATVWIFGSLWTNTQSILRSDGTRNFAHGGKKPTYRSQAVLIFQTS